MNNARLNWVDYAKGIGIILVVYGHVLRGMFSANLGLNENFYSLSDNIVYSFHMPLFFLLSGIFAERWFKKLPTQKGILEKAKTLLIPYIIWSVIQGAFNIVMSSFTNSQVTISSLIHDILFAPYGQFWFVYFLFIIFIMYALLRKFVLLPLLTTVFLILYFVNDFLVLPYHLDTLFTNTIYFILGAFIFTIVTGNTLERYLSKSIFQVSSVLGFIVVCALFLNFQSIIAFEFLSAIFGIAMILSISQLLSQRNALKWFETLGKNSMPIYLMHILAASGTRVILDKFLNIDNIVLHILLGTLVGVVAPLVFYLIVKNIKISHIIFGTKNNKEKIVPPLNNKTVEA